MASKLYLLSAMLVTLIAAGSTVEGKRISQIKCEEFIRGTQQETKVIALTLNPTPIVFKSFVCSRSVDLILGGEDAKEAEFPHQALLGYRTQDSDEYEFDCGGTLVSEWYVLTAAHCMKRGKPSFVRLGESNLKQRSAQEFNIEIDYIIRHPQHRFKESYHDIALIKLMERVYFSNYVQPACLWDDLNDTISPVIATGFGVTESERRSDKLRKVQLEIMDSSECENIFWGLRSFTRGIVDSQLCIGSSRNQGDTCQGDSGGPVQVLLNPNGCIYHVLAITSVGAGCGQASAVYTKVASYIEWIENIVWA
ncbi:serine protease snake-like [Ochlerotatus camptorhynchus]|uniref:serine protease snake-like n=1 Tax=Ochlerotatus camptorhynchus TaxID=644619 RepID=UPI0031D60C57